MISIIIPFYNEVDSLPTLINQLIEVGKKIKEEYEIILVDDGSTDEAKLKVILRQAQDNAEQSRSIKSEKLKVIFHRKRLGKGKALLDGFNNSQGDVIVFMDADLQDNPEELPRFLTKIKEGYNFINGWRKERKDPISKTLPSFIFNFLVLKIIFRSKFHDINCGFKAMKREVLEEIPLYGDNYRFLPILAENAGFKTAEIIVSHKKRIYGKSKYGFWRLFTGLIDTFATYFIFKFSERPLHFFGMVGGTFFTLGFIIAFYLTLGRLFYGILLYRRPILLLAILLIIMGIQILMTGVIGELIVYLNKKSK